MKKLAKILLLVLAVAMLLGAFVMIASADSTNPKLVAIVYDAAGKETKRYEAKDETDAAIMESINNALYHGGQPGSRIVLQRDIVSTGMQWGGNCDDVILDLNGHTITAASALDKDALFFNYTYTYTVDKNYTNPTLTYKKGETCPGGIQFTISNGTIKTDGQKLYAVPYAHISKLKTTKENVELAQATSVTFKDVTITHTAAPSNEGFVYQPYGHLNFDGCDVTFTGYAQTKAYIQSKSDAGFNTYISVRNSVFRAPNASSFAGESTIGTANNEAFLFGFYKNTATSYDASVFTEQFFEAENSSFITAGTFIAPSANSTVTMRADNCYIETGADTPNSSGSVIGQWNNSTKGTYTFTGCNIAYSNRFIATDHGDTAATLVSVSLSDCDVRQTTKYFRQPSKFVTKYTPVTADGSCRFAFNTNSSETPVAISGMFTATVGTRFNMLPNSCYYDTDTYKIVFDPAGDAEFPYVIARDTTDGAASYFFENFSGGSLIAFEPANVSVDGANVTVNSDYVLPTWILDNDTTNPGISASGAMYSKPVYLRTLAPKHGLVETPTVGPNAYFKYTVLAPANNPEATTVNYGSLDAYSTVGRNDVEWKYSLYNRFAIDFMIMADSDKGFADTVFTLSSRYKDGETTTGISTSGLYLHNDGTLTPEGSSIGTGASIKLDLNDWNHVSVLIDKESNTVSWTVNGVLACTTLIGNIYLVNNETAYLEGVRFNTLTNTDLVVGSSLALDNFVFRAYDDSSAIPAVKAPDLYENEDITVNGIPFTSVKEALAFASTTGSAVELHGDIDERETLDVNGTIITNGFKLPFTAESHAAVVAMEGDVVAKYVFDSTKNDIALSDNFVWLDNVLNPSDVSTKLPFKLGHTFEYYLPTETLTHKIDIEWDSRISDHFGKLLTEDLIEQLNGVAAAEPTGYTITEKVQYKTNVSFTSDFKINVYVPYFAYEEMITENKDSMFTREAVIENVCYMQATLMSSLLEADDALSFFFEYQVGSSYISDLFDLSVTSYADAILSDENVTDENALLMYYMLNYINQGFEYKEMSAPEKVSELLSAASEKYNAITHADKNAWSELSLATQTNTLAGAGIFSEVYIDLSAASPKFVFAVKDTFSGTITITYGEDPSKVLFSGTFEQNSNELITLDLDLFNFAAVLDINGYNFNYAAYANALQASSASELLEAFWAFIKYSALYVS